MLFPDLNDEMQAARSTLQSFNELITDLLKNYKASLLFGLFLYFLIPQVKITVNNTFSAVYFFLKNCFNFLTTLLKHILNILHFLTNREAYNFFNEKTIQELKNKDDKIKELEEKIK